MRASTPPVLRGDAAPPRAVARFHQLDGLRALAVVLVVLHHAALGAVASRAGASGHEAASRMLMFGSSGVELFFVLSGVVLLRPYLRGARTFAPGTYLRRRVERLWPPYLAAWVVSGVVILLTTEFPTWWTLGASLPTFTVSRWLSQLGIIYTGRHFNFAWWSLTVEILFYAVVPLLVPLIVRARPSRRAMLLAWVGSAVAASAAYVRFEAHPDALVPWPLKLLVEYASCFGAGVLLAMYDFPASWGRAAIGLGALGCGAAFLWPSVDAHVGYSLVYSGLIVVALSQGRLGAWLSRWPFVWLGERSYSLFLIHFAVFTGVCHAVSLVSAQKGPAYFLLTRGIELPMALLAAMVIFSALERRFAKGLTTGDAFWPALRRPGGHL